MSKRSTIRNPESKGIRDKTTTSILKNQQILWLKGEINALQLQVNDLQKPQPTSCVLVIPSTLVTKLISCT